MLMPVDRTGENPLWSDPEPYYDDFYAIWDTYRSSSPLITLIDPKREADIVRSLVNIYKRDGICPMHVAVTVTAVRRVVRMRRL